MPSSLGWVDYDPHERERTTRILALFRAREARDELGLGGVRDSISDQLFPGTSTIQTRLRYMLFVPWIYRQLEEEQASAADIARKARRVEVALIDALLEKSDSGEREAGVLGRVARGSLKRLPSAIYWAGLASWGIRPFPGNQDQYHYAFDRLHARRYGVRRREDGDLHDGEVHTWHPGLPAAPAGFPESASFRLTRAEAVYLRDRLCERHGGSLLARLASHDEGAAEVPFLWQHPLREQFSREHEELVHHAELFAQVMAGAALIYNLELARLSGRHENEAEHSSGLDAWCQVLSTRDAVLRDWRPSRFWTLTVDRGHAITPATRRFVESWLELALSFDRRKVDCELGRTLVRERERRLKGSRSRFDNKQALGQWSGNAGTGIASYRWPVTARLLADLHEGLRAEES
jgi:hypothetical protein